MGRELRPFIGTDGPLVKVLGLIERQRRELKEGIAAANLQDPEEVRRAIHMQGVVAGLQKALEIVREPIEEFENERRP